MSSKPDRKISISGEGTYVVRGIHWRRHVSSSHPADAGHFGLARIRGAERLVAVYNSDPRRGYVVARPEDYEKA